MVRAQNRLPKKLSFQTYPDPPSAAVAVAVTFGSGLKSTAPVKVPPTYTFPDPSKARSATVSLAVPPSERAQTSLPSDPYLATNTSVPPWETTLATPAVLGSRSRVPVKVPATIWLPTRSEATRRLDPAGRPVSWMAEARSPAGTSRASSDSTRRRLVIDMRVLSRCTGRPGFARPARSPGTTPSPGRSGTTGKVTDCYRPGARAD